MPAGVPMKQYVMFMTAALSAMFAGSQLVHTYYHPLQDLNHYIDQEIKSQRLQEVKTNVESSNEGGIKK